MVGHLEPVTQIVPDRDAEFEALGKPGDASAAGACPQEQKARAGVNRRYVGKGRGRLCGGPLLLRLGLVGLETVKIISRTLCLAGG